MTMIEALLALPEDGRPEAVCTENAAALVAAPVWMVHCSGLWWFLAEAGRRFLLQFRQSEPLTRIIVRLAKENGRSVFHLFANDGVVFTVQRNGLHQTLQTLQTANPGLQVVFDYRSPGSLPWWPAT